MSVLFAATYPERVSHLVLMGCFSRSADRFSDEAWKVRLDQIIKSWGSGELIKTIAPGGEWQIRRDRAICEVRATGEQPRSVADAFAAQSPRSTSPRSCRHYRCRPWCCTAQLRPSGAVRAWPQARCSNSRCQIYRVSGWPSRVLGSATTRRSSAISRSSSPAIATTAPTSWSACWRPSCSPILSSSTRSAAAMGDQRWLRLLGDHDQIAKELVGKHRGNLVKSTGDGVVATFDGPGRAVRCALAFGSAAKQIGLPVRAGLVTGEIEYAARISAASPCMRPRA